MTPGELEQDLPWHLPPSEQKQLPKQLFLWCLPWGSGHLMLCLLGSGLPQDLCLENKPWGYPCCWAEDGGRCGVTDFASDRAHQAQQVIERCQDERPRRHQLGLVSLTATGQMPNCPQGQIFNDRDQMGSTHGAWGSPCKVGSNMVWELGHGRTAARWGQVGSNRLCMAPLILPLDSSEALRGTRASWMF